MKPSSEHAVSELLALRDRDVVAVTGPHLDEYPPGSDLYDRVRLVLGDREDRLVLELKEVVMRWAGASPGAFHGGRGCGFVIH